LETEYNKFFAGRLPKPPWATRAHVEALIKQYDRAHIPNYGERFKLATLQARFSALVDLWDRGLRAREEGRPGPFRHTRDTPSDRKPEVRVLNVTVFQDPTREAGKLEQLYDSVSDARREAGEPPVSFARFAKLVADQAEKLKAQGPGEVAFRVAVKDGKVNFTVRAVKTGK
jgi:hypothetical protein